MHTCNRRRVKRQNKERAALVSSFLHSYTMSRPAAEQAAKAVKHGLDLWAWQQGRVQFLSAKQISLAMTHGLSSWVEEAVNGVDSAAPFFTIRDGWKILRKYYPEVFAVHTRCAGRRGDHSTWAYGPVYLSPQAARLAGHTYQCVCGCGRIANPI